MSTSSPSPHKRSPRVVVNQPAFLEDDTGKKTACTIVDVSQDGFRVRLDQAIGNGSYFTLRTGAEVYRTEIRWASPDEAGGLFLNQLH